MTEDACKSTCVASFDRPQTSNCNHHLCRHPYGAQLDPAHKPVKPPSHWDRDVNPCILHKNRQAKLIYSPKAEIAKVLKRLPVAHAFWLPCLFFCLCPYIWWLLSLSPARPPVRLHSCFTPICHLGATALVGKTAPLHVDKYLSPCL